jgi:hypothetical protein
MAEVIEAGKIDRGVIEDLSSPYISMLTPKN